MGFSAGVSLTQHRETQHKSNADSRNKLKISWPPEKKGSSHSHVSQSNSSASGKINELSYRNHSSAKSSSRKYGLDETDASVKLSPNVYEKSLSSFTVTAGVKASQPGGPKSFLKTTVQCETQSRVSKQDLNSGTFKPDCVKEHILPEDGDIGSATKTKKTVRFASNIDTDVKSIIKIETDITKTSNASVDLNGDAMKTTEDVTTLTSRKETDESLEECLVKNSHAPSNNDFSGYQIALDEVDLPQSGIQENTSQNNPENNDEESISDLQTIPNLCEQIKYTEACEKEPFKPNSHSCDLEQVVEIKNEIIGTPTNTNVTSTNQDATDVITDEPKEPDTLDTPPKTDEKCNTKAAEKKPAAKPNKGSWSKGKSPLSKLFTSPSKAKENKSENKNESKRPDAKPRNLLSRLLSSTEVKPDEEKMTEEMLTACEKEQEQVGETEGNENTSLIQDNLTLSSPPETVCEKEQEKDGGTEEHENTALIQDEFTFQNIPHDPIKTTQNLLSDAQEEYTTEKSEEPIILTDRSFVEETASSVELDSTQQLKSLSDGLVEIDNGDPLMDSQESSHIDLTFPDSSKPSNLESILNSSLPQNENMSGLLDSSDLFTSQVEASIDTNSAHSDSNTETFECTKSGMFTDQSSIDPFLGQEEPFEEIESTSNGDAILTSENETFNIFGSSESNIETSDGNTYLSDELSNETGVFVSDNPFAVSNVPEQVMDIFGENSPVVASDQMPPQQNVFDMITNNESHNQNPFENIVTSQPDPNHIFDLISSESDPPSVSETLNVFDQTSSESNLIQSEVQTVFDHPSTTNVFDENIEQTKSTQMDAFDLFSAEQDPSSVVFSQNSADPFFDPFPNDIFTNSNTGTHSFSVEKTQTNANPFGDFTGLEGHSEVAKTTESVLFDDDIFSSVPAMAPSQESSSQSDQANIATNAENDWLSDFLS